MQIKRQKLGLLILVVSTRSYLVNTAENNIFRNLLKKCYWNLKEMYNWKKIEHSIAARSFPVNQLATENIAKLLSNL